MSEKISVKRSVYNAAQKLQKTAEANGGKDYSLAEKKMGECQTAGDKAGVTFWRDVWLYLISVAYMDSTTEIIEDRP